MAIIDRVSSLMPFRREHGSEQERQRGPSDALALRNDVDRWLQSLFEDPFGFMAPPVASRLQPSVDVRETDNEVIIKAEIPGMDPEDVELVLTDRGLTIRGEKRESREEKDPQRGTYLSEVRYGSFSRTVPLPPGVDPDKAEASVAKGVLTVRVPKTAASGSMRRIPVKAEGKSSSESRGRDRGGRDG